MNTVIPFAMKCVSIAFAVLAALMLARVAGNRERAVPCAALKRRARAKELLAGLRMKLPSTAERAIASAPRFSLPALSFLRARRARRAARMLPDALAMMGGSLKAGMSIQQALEAASAELQGPLGDELAACVEAVHFGASIEEALEQLARRLACEEIELFVRSVEILRRSGGNMIECFDRIRVTAESRRKVAERIRTLTAQGVMQAATLLLLPWCLLVALRALSPAFVAPLFETRLGNLLLVLVVALELFGAVWLRSIVMIRV